MINPARGQRPFSPPYLGEEKPPLEINHASTDRLAPTALRRVLHVDGRAKCTM
jgi:hypothetical protein